MKPEIWIVVSARQHYHLNTPQQRSDHVRRLSSSRFTAKVSPINGIHTVLQTRCPLTALVLLKLITLFRHYKHIIF